jgi:hypothetical protein
MIQDPPHDAVPARRRGDPVEPIAITSESGVEIEAPTGNPLASVTIQLFALAPLPSGGPVIDQPSSPVSNEVLLPSGKVTSSMNVPRF